MDEKEYRIFQIVLWFIHLKGDVLYVKCEATYYTAQSGSLCHEKFLRLLRVQVNQDDRPGLKSVTLLEPFPSERSTEWYVKCRTGFIKD